MWKNNWKSDLRYVGEICMKKYGSNKFNKYKNISIETNHYVIKLPMDIVYHIIEKEKQKRKDDPIGILQTFYQNKYIIELMCTKYQTVDPLFTHLFQILKYCKINCLYLSYVIIHEIYLENMLNHVDLYPAWRDPFKLSENYKKIHCDILSRLKENHYLITEFHFRM